MASTRKEIAERKTALVAALRYGSNGRDSLRGSAALSHRELSAAYGLSQRTVALLLQELVKEGVLYTIPRVGTFIAHQASPQDCYLFLSDGLRGDREGDWHRDSVQSGFEGRIAQLGGSCLSMHVDKALEFASRAELPAIKGVFGFSEAVGLFEEDWNLAAGHPFHGIHCVVYQADCHALSSEHQAPVAKPARANCTPDRADVLSFDNEDGGYQATRHLMRAGHESIAYLGLHSAGVPMEEQRVFVWSMRREAGWREALRRGGLYEDYAIHPDHPLQDKEPYKGAAYNAILALLREKEGIMGRITAVVTANDEVALGLFKALHHAAVPMERWPAVVSFDDELRTNDNILTSLQLPWLEMGQEAATLLWRRGSESAAPEARVQRLLPMRLIPRLSSRQGWSRLTGEAMLSGATRKPVLTV